MGHIILKVKNLMKVKKLSKFILGKIIFI